MVFDTDSERDRRARARLSSERIAWLTTVTPEGQPQTLPVWFVWDGATVVVYSDRRAARNANLAANPRVSLHLADDGTGGDIVFLEGEATVDPAIPAVPGNAAYLAKYGNWIERDLVSPELFAERYSVPVSIRPTRGRSPY